MDRYKSFREIYDKIYSAGLITHRKGGVIGVYGAESHLDHSFIDWIKANLPLGARVLDASCGLGKMALDIKRAGYEVEVTEFSKWVCNNVLKKLGLPVHNLSYEELGTLPENSFDCVISRDVLEHLCSEESALLAISNLVRLSRGFVCARISCNKGYRQVPLSLDMKVGDTNAYSLHTFVRPHTWWIELLDRYLDHDTAFIDYSDKKGLHYFGCVK